VAARSLILCDGFIAPESDCLFGYAYERQK
jgi:hypothetical protein